MPSQPAKPQTPPHRADEAPSTAASLASHAHSSVIAGVSYACFGGLVADPPSALLSSLPLLALAQLVYVVVCLDPSASRGKRAKAAKKGDPTPGISSRLLVRPSHPPRGWIH